MNPRALHAAFPVAALYVDPKGPYRDLVADGAWYDAERDATTFPDDRPVVAHPPCGPWGKLAWNCRQDRTLAPHAVGVVRKCGGVLEHPVGSRLFAECGVPHGDWTNPERETDAWGGYTIKAPQFDWGHRGQKDTILYIVGTADLPPLFRCESGTTPHPVQNMGKRERRLTPPAFAWWLCNLASRCTPPPTRTSP